MTLVSDEMAIQKRTNVRFSPARLMAAALPATLRVAAWLAPALGARVALDLWIRPRRHPMPAREKEWVATARQTVVGGLPAWEWGRGPTVLLVHGWEGRGSQMGALGNAFAAAGFRAVSVDLPAHGRAGGRALHLGSAAQALSRVFEALDPIEAVVAHSFGAAVTARVLDRGAWANKLVLMAPADPSRAIDRYTDWLGLSPDVARRMEDLLGAQAGVHPCEVTPEALAGGLRAPGLVVHDPDDRVVPYADGAAYAEHWATGDLVPAPGSGHQRVLREADVVARVVGFVSEPRSARQSARSAS